MSRFTLIALAATKACMDIFMRPHEKRGPLPPPVYHLHPVEMVIGQLLSLPLMPADIDMSPDPLWLGLRLYPPEVLEVSPVAVTAKAAGFTEMAAQMPSLRRRLPMPEYMARLARQLGHPERGDEAKALGGSVMRALHRDYHFRIQAPSLPPMVEIDLTTEERA